MKKKIWGPVAIAIFAVAATGVQGFTYLDRILANQTAEAWNAIYDRQEETIKSDGVDAASAPVATDGRGTSNPAALTSVDKEAESRIIRSGLPGNNLCTFACNVDWGEDILPGMLEVFKEKNVRVTFFVTGRWAENNPELLKEMYDAGHEIQSHGYSHALCSDISSEKVEEEIEKTELAIIDAINIKPNYFAPAAGDYDERTLEIAERLGYKVVLWSSDTIDWREGSSADVITQRIMAKPLDGAIILMHPKPETLKALPDLIEQINAQGCRIVPLYRMPV
ncbi:polysaccharide deacetylase family protein [Aminipila butyrica]|uniref:Polysaccharide deacetylase family protein n=1 Tax=Aminipila butyrica TaxID=433296 RepID=A0A858BWD7_9FIRM|nr:polysaccharide deacetylase family protein [Aminipila butyrica]QIB69499.1 polysaccharide deacetylase family protein [Aminipila butyrica]